MTAGVLHGVGIGPGDPDLITRKAARLIEGAAVIAYPTLAGAASFARSIVAGLIPEDAEAQWISVDGSTVELVVWTGKLARPGIRRSALVIRGGSAAELTAAGDADDAPVRELGAYLHGH